MIVKLLFLYCRVCMSSGKLPILPICPSGASFFCLTCISQVIVKLWFLCRWFVFVCVWEFYSQSIEWIHKQLQRNTNIRNWQPRAMCEQWNTTMRVPWTASRHALPKLQNDDMHGMWQTPSPEHRACTHSTSEQQLQPVMPRLKFSSPVSWGILAKKIMWAPHQRKWIIEAPTCWSKLLKCPIIWHK